MWFLNQEHQVTRDLPKVIGKCKSWKNLHGLKYFSTKINASSNSIFLLMFWNILTPWKFYKLKLLVFAQDLQFWNYFNKPFLWSWHMLMFNKHSPVSSVPFQQDQITYLLLLSKWSMILASLHKQGKWRWKYILRKIIKLVQQNLSYIYDTVFQ